MTDGEDRKKEEKWGKHEISRKKTRKKTSSKQTNRKNVAEWYRQTQKKKRENSKVDENER